MHDIIFVGDEVTAAGFRLAGVPVHSPPPDALVALIHDQRDDCAMIVMTAEYHRLLPERLRDTLETADTPLLAVIDDLRGAVPAPGLDAVVKRALGIEVPG